MRKKSFFLILLPVIFILIFIWTGCKNDSDSGNDDKNDPGEGIPQTVPANLSVTPTGISGQLAVSWDAVTGAFFYELRWGTGTFGTPVEIKGTSHVVTGLSNDTDYNFQVRAVSGSFESEWSTAVSGRPSNIPLSELPAIPENLQAEGEVVGDYGIITISWDAAANADSYRMEWGTNPNNWSGAAIENLSETTTTVEISDVGEYFFRVRSVKGANISGTTTPVSVKFVRMVRTITTPSQDVKKMRTVVVGPDGMLYTVKTDDPHTAWRIDPSSIDLSDPNSRATHTVFANHGDPGHVWTAGYLAKGPDNYLYGARIWGRDVFKWDLSDTSGDAVGIRVSDDIHVETELNPGQAIWGGIAVGPDGSVFVVSAGEKVIIKIPPPVDGVLSTAVIHTIEGTYANNTTVRKFQDIDSMTWGHDDAVYISDGFNDGAIWRIDPDTGETRHAFGKHWNWGNPFQFVYGMAYHDGYYYFVHGTSGNTGGTAIYKMRPESDAQPVLIAGHRDEFGRVDGFAQDARFFKAKGIAVVSGAIYVVDRNDSEDSTIRMISPLEVLK